MANVVELPPPICAWISSARRREGLVSGTTDAEGEGSGQSEAAEEEEDVGTDVVSAGQQSLLGGAEDDRAVGDSWAAMILVASATSGDFVKKLF